MPAGIRRASPEDIDAMVDLRLLFERITRDSPSFDEAARRAELIALMGPDLASGALVAWLAEEGGRAVAQAALRILPAPPAVAGGGSVGVRGGPSPAGEILNVYTLPAFRGRGIATSLLALAVGEARALGLSRLRLQPTESSRRIYERAGFADAGRRMEMALAPPDPSVV